MQYLHTMVSISVILTAIKGQSPTFTSSGTTEVLIKKEPRLPPLIQPPSTLAGTGGATTPPTRTTPTSTSDVTPTTPSNAPMETTGVEPDGLTSTGISDISSMPKINGVPRGGVIPLNGGATTAPVTVPMVTLPNSSTAILYPTFIFDFILLWVCFSATIFAL